MSNCKLQLTSTLKTAYVLASKPNTGNREIKHRVYGKREIQVDKFPNEKQADKNSLKRQFWIELA